MKALKVGNGLDDGVAVGPLVNADTRDKVVRLVEDALARGARAVTGGKRPDGIGFYYPPTVLVNVPDDARLLEAKRFSGPSRRCRNSRPRTRRSPRRTTTEYGLVAYLYTRDMARGLRVSEKLESGMVGLEPRRRVRSGRALRRRQAIRPRPRGRA